MSEGVEEVVPGEAVAFSVGVESLLARSSAWLADAMDAWAREEQDKVTALAPLAVELAVKAFLLHANPALLVPLERQHEASLINLTTRVDLDDPKLRTIGLAEALARSDALAADNPSPIDKTRRARLVACRNGSMHVGGVPTELGRFVLADSIAVIDWTLNRLGRSREGFFGKDLDDYLALADAGRSEAQRIVDQKVSRHRRLYESTVPGLPADSVESVFVNMEEGVLTAHLPVDENGPDFIAAHVTCPSCGRQGGLYGLLDLDGDVDVDWSDGQMVLNGYWVIGIHPESFVCDVCRLRLWGVQDLKAAGLPHAPYEPASEDLGDFDPALYSYGYPEAY